MEVAGGIGGFFVLLFLFDIATEVTKIRKALNEEIASRHTSS